MVIRIHDEAWHQANIGPRNTFTKFEVLQGVTSEHLQAIHSLIKKMESLRTIKDPCVGGLKLWKIAWMEEGEIPISHVEMLKLEDSSKGKCRRGCNRISRYVTPHPPQATASTSKHPPEPSSKWDHLRPQNATSLSWFHCSYLEDWRFKNSFESVVPPLWILG